MSVRLFCVNMLALIVITVIAVTVFYMNGGMMPPAPKEQQPQVDNFWAKAQQKKAEYLSTLQQHSQNGEWEHVAEVAAKAEEEFPLEWQFPAELSFALWKLGDFQGARDAHVRASGGRVENRDYVLWLKESGAAEQMEKMLRLKREWERSR